MKYILATALAAQLLATPALAKSVKVFAHNRIFDLAIPEGMCNVTHTSVGDNLRAFLTDANSTDSLLPVAHVIFQSCETAKQVDKTGISYPWGYIGIPKALDPELSEYTQQQLNEAMQSDSMVDVVTEYMDSLDESFDETRKEWNMNTQVDASEGYTSLVANDSIFVGYMKITGVAEGEAFVEHALFSSTLINGVLLNYYVYEAEDASDQLPTHVESLKEAAEFNVAEGT